MKRIIGIFLIVLLLWSCTGCQEKAVQNNAMTFYYRTASLSYKAGSTVIVKEEREIQQMDSWAYVLNIYLKGPEDGNLRSPFPDNLQVVKTVMENGTLYLTVSQELSKLTGLELTLACSCLALTCLDLTGAQAVIVSAENALLNGQKSITMNRNTFLLSDIAGGE